MTPRERMGPPQRQEFVGGACHLEGPPATHSCGLSPPSSQNPLMLTSSSAPHRYWPSHKQSLPFARCRNQGPVRTNIHPASLGPRPPDGVRVCGVVPSCKCVRWAPVGVLGSHLPRCAPRTEARGQVFIEKTRKGSQEVVSLAVAAAVALPRKVQRAVCDRLLESFISLGCSE